MPLRGLAETDDGLDAAGGVRHLPPIFKWFAADFTNKASSLERFGAPYIPEADRELILSGKLKIKYTDDDWSLNKQ